MKKIIFSLILIIMVCGFVFSAGSKEIEPLISGDPNSRNKILILVDISEYRFALTQAIENNLLGYEDISIIIDDLGSYSEYVLDDFSALVLLNAGMAGRINGTVKKIIGLSEKKHIIVITTWGGKPPKKDIGVDSITAASSVGNIKEKVNNVREFIEKYLK